MDNSDFSIVSLKSSRISVGDTSNTDDAAGVDESRIACADATDGNITTTNATQTAMKDFPTRRTRNQALWEDLQHPFVVATMPAVDSLAALERLSVTE